MRVLLGGELGLVELREVLGEDGLERAQCGVVLDDAQRCERGDEREGVVLAVLELELLLLDAELRLVDPERELWARREWESCVSVA